MSARRKFTAYEKDAVYSTYGGRCALCGRPVSRKMMTIDHKVPLSKGGTNGLNNLMLACLECNHIKSNLNMEELREKIREILNYIDDKTCSICSEKL